MKPTWSYVREALSKRFRASCINTRLLIVKGNIDLLGHVIQLTKGNVNG